MTFVNGMDISGTLTEDTPLLYTTRNVQLTGTLADGTSFTFDLNSGRSFEGDYFSSLADVNLILVSVPEPGLD